MSGEILKNLTAGVTYYYSPNYNNLEYGVVEASLSYALPKVAMFTPTVSGLYGNQQAFDNISTDYSYWNAGLALGVENLTFDFRYWDTDISNSDCGSPADSNAPLQLAVRVQHDLVAAISPED